MKQTLDASCTSDVVSAGSAVDAAWRRSAGVRVAIYRQVDECAVFRFDITIRSCWQIYIIFWTAWFGYLLGYKTIVWWICNILWYDLRNYIGSYCFCYTEKIPGQWHIGNIAHWQLGQIKRREILHKLICSYNLYTTQRYMFTFYYKHW